MMCADRILTDTTIDKKKTKKKTHEFEHRHLIGKNNNTYISFIVQGLLPLFNIFYNSVRFSRNDE